VRWRRCSSDRHGVSVVSFGPQQVGCAVERDARRVQLTATPPTLAYATPHARARRAGGRMLQCQWLRQLDRVAAGCSCKANAAVILSSCVHEPREEGDDSRADRDAERQEDERADRRPPVPYQRPAPDVSAVEWRRLAPPGMHRRRATRRLLSPFWAAHSRRAHWRHLDRPGRCSDHGSAGSDASEPGQRGRIGRASGRQRLHRHRAGSARLRSALKWRPAQVPIGRLSRSHSSGHRSLSGRVLCHGSDRDLPTWRTTALTTKQA
jgi:hypothetical protein